MPVRPPPCTYVCAKCGWKKTVQPISDALVPGDILQECPLCGNDKLEVKIEKLHANPLGQLFSILKR